MLLFTFDDGPSRRTTPRLLDMLDQLGIKDSTFRSYVKSIYRKTGTHSRTELTRVIMGHK